MEPWLAVVGAVVCFGSFGVPIKSRRVIQAQADALIIQLFKSVACFGSSLAVLLFKNFSWSWWAVLGAVLWVASGTLAIYAIQRAGLGIAQTTYTCLTIAVPYLWGVLAFHEVGSSAGLALLGLSLIAVGLVGLGHAAHAAPHATLQRVPSAESTTFFHSADSRELQSSVLQDCSAQPIAVAADSGAGGGTATSTRKGGMPPVPEAEFDPGPPPKPAGELNNGKRGGSGGALNGGGGYPELHVRIGAQLHHRSISAGDLGSAAADDPSALEGASPTSCSSKDVEAARLLHGPPGELGIILRQNWVALRVRLWAAWASGVGRGAMAAALVGLLNGSFLVPFKLERWHDQAQGMEYVVPFAAASLLATLLVCFVYYGLVKGQRPQLHLQAVAGPALLTGLLWSVGNLCSIWAVQSLGLSVGFPLVQCQLIVSTTWAVLYYKEAPVGLRSMLAFVGSTLVVVAGMLLLAVFGS